MWLERNPSRLRQLADPGLMLEVDADNDLVVRLNHYGLLPGDLRARFPRGLIEYCITGLYDYG